MVESRAVTDGWVRRGEVISYKGNCYYPSKSGGLGNQGIYYGPDYSSCKDAACVCITPTPTPTVTPETTPVVNDSYTTALLVDIFESDEEVKINIPNDSFDKVFYVFSFS